MEQTGIKYSVESRTENGKEFFVVVGRVELQIRYLNKEKAEQACIYNEAPWHSRGYVNTRFTEKKTEMCVFNEGKHCVFAVDVLNDDFDLAREYAEEWAREMDFPLVYYATGNGI